MFQTGSHVIYGIHGVCTVLGTEHRKIDRSNAEYYILEPIKQPGDRYYIPTQNATAVGKLKPLLTKEELDAMLASPEVGRDIWITDEALRKQCYREVISSNDRAALISMIKSLHVHRDEQLTQGRKFHQCDENFLRDAETLLSSEFSLILGITPSEVGEYIRNAING